MAERSSDWYRGLIRAQQCSKVGPRASGTLQKSLKSYLLPTWLVGCLFARQTPKTGLPSPSFPLWLASAAKWFLSVGEKRGFGHRVWNIHEDKREELKRDGRRNRREGEGRKPMWDVWGKKKKKRGQIDAREDSRTSQGEEIDRDREGWWCWWC